MKILYESALGQCTQITYVSNCLCPPESIQRQQYSSGSSLYWSTLLPVKGAK